jgi:hypothetical protein
MASFSSLSKNIGKLISTKPRLISSEDLKSAGDNIKLVGVDPLKSLDYQSDKPFSPRLLNWVEPYIIGGIRKTLFYTEVNSGLKVGDRVFILNGNYDNDLLIKLDKYKKGRDGYKVIFIDNCQVVLDIDYIGVPVWQDDDLDQFIKVRNVKTKEDFLNVNREITTREGSFDYKYNYYQNSIIYTEQNWDPLTSWGQNDGLVGSPGFFVRDDIDGWTNITTEFMSGSFSYALSPTYTNNNKVRILNDTFSHSFGGKSFEFKEGFTYEWGTAPEHDAVPGTQSEWIINILYNQSLLTKGNFRNGNFKGDWNTGVYGRQDEKIKWEGKGSWYNGTLLNTEWEDGTFDSKYTLPESYLSELDEYGIPYQKVNKPDNNNKGFNYIIDSEIKKSVVNNGNFINTNIGGDISLTYSIVESHILRYINKQLGITQKYNNTVNKAFFENCRFEDAFVNNSEVKTSRSTNTMFNNIKSVNSNYGKSVIKNSNYLSDEIIKILDYDEFNISEYKSGGTFSSREISHKVYKFYLSRSDFERLKLKDSFYIKGIKINDNSKDVIKFFDDKFRVGSWTRYIDGYTTTAITQPIAVAAHSFYKRGIEYSVFLSTPGDNEWRYTSVNGTPGSYTDVVDENSKKGYSIDVVVSIYDIHSPSGPTDVAKDFNRSSDITLSDIPTVPQYNGGFINIPPLLGNNIDFSKAYIVDSEFESGLFETSNWNSGRHIDYNNDINITTPTTEGGYYNLSISTFSSILTATTTYNSQYPEALEGCMGVGDIVFLNNVDYDTTGKVTSFMISASGSGYTQSNTNVSTIGGSGVNLTVDYTPDTIGTILSINNLTPGGNYGDGPYSNIPITGGLGSGATLDYTVLSNVVISATISNGGIGYQIGDILEIPGATPTASVIVATITNGEVLSATVSTSGIGYQIGDLITINDGGVNSEVTVLSTTGSVTTLPDTYKILSNSPGSTFSTLELEEVITGTYSVLSTLLDGGLFNTGRAYNRYGYIHKSRFDKSKIKSGLFRRTYIKGSFIENDSFDVEDKDFTDLEKIRSLVISDSLFRDNSNILSKGLYMNSHVVDGTDDWVNVLGDSLIWNGSTLKNGVIKRSRWIDGTLKNGTFYESRTFDANPTIYNEFHYNENIKSYYKDGITDEFIFNNRNSWQNGTFEKGEFHKSDWEMGKFNGGLFYYSKFYDGVINGGFIGDLTTSTTDTLVYNGTVSYTTVENATLYAIDTSLTMTDDKNIVWEDGVFNGGVFGCDILQTTPSHTATWKDGTFNDGQFVTNGKWENGIFNGGQFISGYGWTLAGSTTQTDYGWEDGVFNGGEFGNANLATNSIWYSGEFNGGEFVGRYWNDGILTAGKFKGSSTYPAVGGYKVDGMTVSNAYNFVESYTQSYYGKWNTGYFTNIKDKFIKDKKIYSVKERAIKRISLKRATFENALWISGTFSHPSGEFKESVWLDGGFDAGTFKSSSFNPWVIRYNKVPNGYPSVPITVVGSYLTDNWIAGGTFSQNNNPSFLGEVISTATSSNSMTFIALQGQMIYGPSGDDLIDQIGSEDFYAPFYGEDGKSFNLNDDLTTGSGSCVWYNGKFDDSDFYISQWNQGRWLSGTGFGMVWRDGISNYMNAYNICWEDGTWRNGNWQGSYFKFDGCVTDPFNKQILYRVMNCTGTSSMHTWNIFRSLDLGVICYEEGVASNPSCRGCVDINELNK